ncbi:MAG: lactate racemase domain-containing protein [Acidobacteriota bacterium]|jgi:nickel-dependent lactate racemase|nr:lactate racemase domain-containing protein [Acidobacteriota bacterium]
MIYLSRGSVDDSFSPDDVRAALQDALARLGARKRVLALPPDFTRLHSQAGMLTEMAWGYYGERLTDVLPALGTHLPMTPREIGAMFGRVPQRLFRAHDWRGGCVTLGEVPASFVREVSEGKVDYAIPVVLDRLLAEGGHDLILSIGQVVPHEVIGMAGYNKNIFVGTGGGDGIDKTHFLGAVYGMERMMGRADTPVRRVMDYASERFIGHLPIVYVLTVVGKDGAGRLAIRGLFIGDDRECFHRAAALARAVNFQLLDRPVRKAVVWLDPGEFKSTWLGNKAIYRTRMALADGGELTILAPGVARFGEDGGIDRLIRKYGYVGTERVLKLAREQDDLRASLGTAAHLIHGSSEGRFTVTYCPGGLSREEVEGAGFRYGDLAAMTKRYDPEKLTDGYNQMPDGEEVFFVSNPALGLWASRDRFKE